MEKTGHLPRPFPAPVQPSRKSRASLLTWIAKGSCAIAAIAYLTSTVDLDGTLPKLLQARWTLAAIFLFHFIQIALDSAAWGTLLPERHPWPVFFRLRWIREGTSSLLPVGALSAAAVGSRLLCRYGISGSAATASVAVDLAAETAGQFVFLICGIALLPIGSVSGQSQFWLWTLLLAVLGMCASFVIAQRVGLFRLLDWATERVSARWPQVSRVPTTSFHDALLALHAQRQRLFKAVVLHSLSWGLGSVEVWLALRGLGHPISWRSAFVMESIGMAGRSAGFAIPAAVGLQEAGFVLAASLIGVPAGLSIACSLLTRGRELLVAITSLAVLGMEERSSRPSR